MNRVIVYYSLSNNTKEYANRLSEYLGIPAIEIVMKKRMPKCKFLRIMYGGMLNTFNKKPDIDLLESNFSEYRDIIIGTPVWAGKMAAPVATFLTYEGVCERINAVFTLSGSGDDCKCMDELSYMLPNLKYHVSLLDKNSKESNNNNAKFIAFSEALLNG